MKRFREGMTMPRACILGAVMLLATSTASAVDYYWTNAVGDGDYTNPQNWTPNGLPQTTDYTSDVVVLGEPGGTPHAVTRLDYANPSWATTRNLLHIRFETAGWTFLTLGTVANLRTLRSAGEGQNTVDFYLNQQSNQTWIVGAGNTLYLARSFYCRNHTVTVRGAGTLWLSTRFGGFGSGTYGLRLEEEVTLRVDDSIPSGIGRVWLASQDVTLRLQTTVAAGYGIIGSRVFDETGNGLLVTDIGDGFVEFSVLPPVPEATLITLQ